MRDGKTLLELAGALIVLAAIDEPRDGGEDHDNGDDENVPVHEGAACDGNEGREDKADRGDEEEAEGDKCDRATPAAERVLDVVVVSFKRLFPADEQEERGDKVRDLEEDDRGAEDGIQGGGRTEVWCQWGPAGDLLMRAKTITQAVTK